MQKKLSHHQIQDIVSSLGASKIINLDASINSLLQPISQSLGKGHIGDEVSIHVVCCNEYALVTGLAGGNINEVEALAENIRAAVAKK
jgi:hypothetical protein